MTATSAGVMQPGSSELDDGRDQAHESGISRPHYRVHPQDDGGDWRGPTEAAWTTRVLRGTRAPRQPSGKPEEASVPHG